MVSIAILHYTCPPVVGGVEEVVRQQASLFHRYFHPVKILAGQGAQFTQDYEIELNKLLDSRNPEILELQQNAEKNEKHIHELSEQICEYLKKH